MSLHANGEGERMAAEIAVMIDMGCRVDPCGSRVTCDPVPEASDIDFLVEVPRSDGTVSKIVLLLTSYGFEWEGSEHYQTMISDGFMSWRLSSPHPCSGKGDSINLIVTSNPNFAARHRCATSLCKRLNLLHKPDRIATFRAVLYGITWDAGKDLVLPPQPVPFDVQPFDGEF